MATLVLGTAGSLVPGVGPILGALGAMAGSYIDQRFLLPTLFPQPNVKGPRISELHIQGNDEGAEVTALYGTSARITGNLIWTSGRIEEEVTDSTGGKGGDGGQQTTHFNNYLSMAIVLSRRQCSSLQEIIVEGQKIYDSTPDVDLSGSFTVTVPTVITTHNGMNITSPAGGANLGLLQTGKFVTVSGFVNGSNNGVFKVKVAITNPDGSSRATFRNASAVAEGPNAAIMHQTLPSFNTAKIASVTFYPGSTTQIADSLIEAYEGVGTVPGYRGLCYVVLERFFLNDYGNRVPQMSFVVEASPTETISTTIAGIMLEAGRSGGDYDVTGLSGSVIAFEAAGVQDSLQSMHPLIMAYDILGQETAGVIRFFHRKNATIIEVPWDRLSCREDGNDPSHRSLTETKSSDIKLPRAVTVKYIDPLSDNQVGSQRERRQQSAVDETFEVDVTPLALNATDARALCRRLLWTTVNDQGRVEFCLPYHYLDAQENDIIRTISPAGEIYDLLLHRLDLGQNFVIDIEATIEIQEILTQTGEAEAPGSAIRGAIVYPADVTGMIFDLAMVRDSTVFDGPTLGAGCCVTDPDGHFGGCNLYESYDGTNYHLLRQLTQEARMGYAQTVLADAATDSWDGTSTVDIEILRGTLSSSTDADVLAGANRMKVGDEIIGFVYATLISERVYRLSKLLRGLRNTELATDDHVLGEECMLLTGSGFLLIDLDHAAIGQTRYYRFVGGSQALSDAETITYEITGQSLRPFSPVNVTAVREIIGDVTIEWARRTRLVANTLGDGILPLGEVFERFEVDIIFPYSSETVIRTLSVEDAETLIYEAADTVTDGTDVDSFAIRVYQISAAIGRGNSSDKLTVPG